MQFSTGMKIGTGAVAIGGAATGIAALSQLGNSSNGTLAKTADVVLGTTALAVGGLGAAATIGVHRHKLTFNEFAADLKAAKNTLGPVNEKMENDAYEKLARNLVARPRR